MAGFREEGIKLLDKIEDEIYALTHSPYEAELRTLEQQKEHYVDVLRSNMVDPWQDISEEKLKIEQWFQLKKAELDKKYAGKTTAGYSAALAEYKKHITEMLKLQETLEKELYI